MKVRTCHDWEHGTTRSNNIRSSPDGHQIYPSPGITTIENASVPTPLLPGLSDLEQSLHPRLLTLAERERIADLHCDGHSLRAIGRLMCQPDPSIQRENDDGTYQPFAAHRRAALQRPSPKTSKHTHPGPLREYATEKLRVRWPPNRSAIR